MIIISILISILFSILSKFYLKKNPWNHVYVITVDYAHDV